MTLRRAGLVAGALAALVAGGCSSSGGAGAAAGSPPVSSGPASPSNAAPSSPSSASGVTPSSRQLTAISPVRPITCATVPGHFRHGGALPSGVPVPQAVPKLTCVGAHRAVAVLWTSVAPAQYKQELSNTGWHASGATYTKPHAPRTITVLSIRSALVAIYHPR